MSEIFAKINSVVFEIISWQPKIQIFAAEAILESF